MTKTQHGRLKTALLVTWFILVTIVPAYGAGAAAESSQTVSTQHIKFAPGGTIRWSNSYGDLYIEGWDRPEVEITVMKATRYREPRKKECEAAHLQSVDVSIQRRSGTELRLSTVRRHGKDGVAMEYQVHVPQDSRLVVHHQGGSVTVGNLTGNIDAANRDGDILLMLPSEGNYSIDARSKMGHIASDFEGHMSSRYLVGQHFVRTASSPATNVRLRIGFGGITIPALPPEGERLATADAE